MEQNKWAKIFAQEELEKLISWRGNSLEQIFEIKDEIYSEEKKKSKGFKTLERLKDYPNHIAGGNTWLKVSRGLLENESVVEQIDRFYKDEHKSFIMAMRPGHILTDKPIWIVANIPELEEAVYPVIAKYAKKDCIILLINEGEAV